MSTFIPKKGDVIRFTKDFKTYLSCKNSRFWRYFFETDITVLNAAPSSWQGTPTIKMLLHVQELHEDKAFSVYEETGYPINSTFLDISFELRVACVTGSNSTEGSDADQEV